MPSRLVRIAWLITLAFLLIAQEQPRPIPKYKGDDNPQHDGQPAWCQNWADKTFAANCHCQAMREQSDSCKHPDDYGPDTYDEDSNARCSTHCRKSACQCQRSCST